MKKEAFKNQFDPSDEVHHLRAENERLHASLNARKQTSGQISEAIADVIAGVKIAKPPIIQYDGSKASSLVQSPVTHVIQATDWHIGQTTDATQVEEFGEFNYLTAQRRVGTFGTAVINKTKLMRNAYVCDDAVVLGTADWCCFPPEAPINMEDGTVKAISEVQIGDRVSSRNSFGSITAVHVRDSHTSDAMLTLKAVKVLPVTGTAEHVVLVVPKEKVECGWNPGGIKGKAFVVRDKANIGLDCIEERPLSKLRVGDYLLSQKWRPTDGSSTLDIQAVTGLALTEEADGISFKNSNSKTTSIACANKLLISDTLLKLVGIYAAEGSAQVSHKGGPLTSLDFTLHIKEIEHENMIRNGLRELFGVDVAIKELPEKNTRHVLVHNIILAQLFTKLCSGNCYTKQLHQALWRAPRSLLPLVSAWLDGDGGYGCKTKTGWNFITGKTSSVSLANQITTICYTEGLPVSLACSDRGLNHPSYHISFSGEAAQAIAADTIKYDPMAFTPTYEDGFWIESYYAHRITSIAKAPMSTKLYDLSVSPCSYYSVYGVVVHNSGDIHEELIRTNEFGAPMQAVKAGFLLGAFLVGLSPHFKTVRAEILTAGNHDRITRKPQCEDGGVNSWGYIVASIAQQYVSAVPNIKFKMHTSLSAVVQIENLRYLIMHGDGIIGTFGIPFYGIERRKQREAMARMNMPDATHFDSIVLGHFHAALNHEHWIIGGSLTGTTAFDHKCGRHSRAHQTSWFVHPKHGAFDWSRWWLS